MKNLSRKGRKWILEGAVSDFLESGEVERWRGKDMTKDFTHFNLHR